MWSFMYGNKTLISLLKLEDVRVIQLDKQLLVNKKLSSQEETCRQRSGAGNLIRERLLSADTCVTTEVDLGQNLLLAVGRETSVSVRTLCEEDTFSHWRCDGCRNHPPGLLAPGCSDAA